MKIVINRSFSGFSLSKEAYAFLGLEWDGSGRTINVKRDDPKLIECIEVMGSKANGHFADLKIVEIPDDVKYRIECNKGMEIIREIHRVWY